MKNLNKSVNEDNETNECYDLRGMMATVAQLAKEMNVSRGLIYKLLNEPGGPAFVKLGSKVLIDRREWARFLESKTVRREAIEETSAA
ncbi:excisionase family DNA binding protein [Paraburkholderia unamae]|uniref:helix-turn-helix transcriptional regulator n=1 Tax=Paraburkholderia unamae TaxID=219649 RepID=UPI000DC5013D|nr:hypothetical protein [Paraburkholderia unamae]RAR51474.1 excisionase family DNA binding protein [Paraburkholderia unamae]